MSLHLVTVLDVKLKTRELAQLDRSSAWLGSARSILQRAKLLFLLISLMS